MLAHNVTELIHLRDTKRTFGVFHKLVMVLKKFLNLRYMLDMSLTSFTINQYVVKENLEKGSNIWLQHFIHEDFKGGGNITKSKRNN